MSSIWTPGGEHPVDPGRRRSAPPPPPAGPESDAVDREPTEEELARLRDELAQTPAASVVANHCLGLFELAGLHLSLQPPQLDQAAIAIDAFGAVVEGLAGRLGPDEPTLREALAQLRMAFVQIKAASAEG
jgi:hypothetical protein